MQIIHSKHCASIVLIRQGSSRMGHIGKNFGKAQSSLALRHKLPTFTAGAKALCFSNGFSYCYLG